MVVQNSDDSVDAGMVEVYKPHGYSVDELNEEVNDEVELRCEEGSDSTLAALSTWSGCFCGFHRRDARMRLREVGTDEISSFFRRKHLALGGHISPVNGIVCGIQWHCFGLVKVEVKRRCLNELGDD